jgi:hypothetical protein
MRGHLAAIAAWLAILVAGYFVATHLTAPPPVAR